MWHKLCRIFIDNDFQRIIWLVKFTYEYFREVLNLAHVCRNWRSLVFKYDLLEEFMERFDEDENYISDWIFISFSWSMIRNAYTHIISVPIYKLFLIVLSVRKFKKKDTLEKELKSCCVRLMVTADPVLTAAYQFKRKLYLTFLYHN